MPLPRISSHPVRLHTLHPDPPQLWQEMSIDYHAYYLRYKAYDGIDSLKANAAYYAYDNEMDTSVGTSDKNERLNQICTAAKANNVIVFSIGFEVEDGPADLLEDCASSRSHFYRVEGLEITTAFQSIANAIGKLRLTQ